MKVCRIRKGETLAKSQEPVFMKDSRWEGLLGKSEISYFWGVGCQEKLRVKVSILKSHLYEPSSGKLSKIARKS